jgi:hypothetical protein
MFDLRQNNHHIDRLPYIIGEIGWMDDYAGVNVDQFMDRIEQLTGMGYVTGTKTPEPSAERILNYSSD